MSNFEMIFGIFLWIMYVIVFFCIVTYVLFFRLAYKNGKGTVENVLKEEKWQPYAERVKEEIAWFEAQEKEQPAEASEHDPDEGFCIPLSNTAATSSVVTELLTCD